MRTTFNLLAVALAALSLPGTSGGQVVQTRAAKVALTGDAADLKGTLPAARLPLIDAAKIGTGTLDPARLGTGTPTSGTVLRGDGSWVGTTPTGNTIAATTNLLLGDGAGNVVALARSSDLQWVLQLRADTVRALGTPPANALTLANLVLGSATLNADGTITIPAGAHIGFGWNNDATVAPRYCYAVATTDALIGVSGGTSGLYIESAFYQYQSTSQGGTSSSPAPGVSRFVFTNNAGNHRWEIYVTNATASAVTIYFPFVSTADAGVLGTVSNADAATVPAQPVANLDYSRFASEDRTGRYLSERLVTLAVDSVHGHGGGDVTLDDPSNTLTDLDNGASPFAGALVGLARGSLFRESMPLGSLTNPRRLAVQDLAAGQPGPLPIISALDPVNPASWTSNGDGSYTYDWVVESSAVDNNGYKAVYVVEVTKATEAATPIASRHRLLNVTFGEVATTSGVAYVSNVGGTTWRARIHPTGGHAPTDNTYRYEVVTRFGPVALPQLSTGDMSVSGLHLVGSSNGYGSLSGPPGFVGDRLVVEHGTAHSAVLGGGSLQRSIFADCGTNTGIALAWYFSDPSGVAWDMRHCLFYANVGDRAANCLLSHSTGSSNYARGDISDCAFLGARWSNGSLQGTAIGYDNVATGTISNVYVQSIREIFGYTMPLSTEVKNSVFRSVNKGRIGFNFHDNIVLAESASDPTDNSYRGPLAVLLQQNGASITNNIFWGRGTDTGVSGDGGVYGLQCYTGVTSASFQRNILVLNPSDTTQAVYGSFAGATGLATDYNLVINLGKVGGGFLVFSPGGNVFTWAEYLAANPTLDQHSMYLDLSSDPRGLKAVFVDPINGDFRWAQTEVARRCAAYCTANHVGPATVPSRWPVVPLVDDAVRMITGL